MANIPGTILAAMISPGDTTATFATHEDIYGKGGLMTFSYLSSLSSIPLDRQKVGMLVYINETQNYYQITSTGSPLTNYSIFNSGGYDTEVRSLTSNWDSTYTTVQAKSANWEASYGSSGADLLVRSLTANWDTTYTTVSANSASWQEAYTFVNSNSSSLSATNIYVSDNLTVTNTVSAKYYKGTIIDWMTLVRGYKTTPTLNATIATGDVYTYVYATTGSDITYYRYIATNGSEDSFYGNFTNPTLSNLITKKGIIL